MPRRYALDTPDKDEIILATVEHVLAIVENVSFSEDVEKIQDELNKLKKEEEDLIKRIESQPVETVVLRKKEKLPKKLRNGW